ncbi:MAG: hypothetical protein QE263_02395 [Vampirovibrionales bacterium]|nr:hypothetical protein [Vampirovibrionales bacterium]
MTYGMQLPYGQQLNRGVQSAGGYRPQQNYNAPVQGGYNAQGVNPMATMWNNSARWMRNQAQNMYAGYQQFAQKHPYLNGAASAGMGAAVAMVSCPYAGMAAAAPGVINAAKNMIPQGHPPVNAGGGNQSGYQGNNDYRTFG